VLAEIFDEMPRIGIEVSSQEAQKRFCVNRGGVAYLARFMVEEEIKAGVLHDIPMPDPHVFNLWLATRKKHKLSLPAEKFLDRLKSAWSTPKA
jgi:DNA-binding transcriptional LysR family regulator